VSEGAAVLPRYFICSTETCKGMHFTIQMIISRLSVRPTHRNISNLNQGHISHLTKTEAVEVMEDVATRCLVVLSLLPTNKLNLPVALEHPTLVDHHVLASTIISNLR